MKKLRSCPFCGNDSAGWMGGSDMESLGYIECSYCYARTGTDNDIQGDAIAKWNSRSAHLTREANTEAFEVVKNLRQTVREMKLNRENMTGADWNYQHGLLLSGNDADLLLSLLGPHDGV